MLLGVALRGFPTPPPNNVAGPSSIWARAREAASRSHRAVSRSGRRGAGPLSNRTESPPTVPTPTMAHKYARSRRGPATCSQQPTVPSDPSGGAPSPESSSSGVVLLRAARDEVGRRRCRRVRRGHRRRVRRIPLHHGTLSPAGCFPVGPGGILPVAHIASYARRYSRGPRQRGRRTPPEGGGG